MLNDSHLALGQLLYRRGMIPQEVDIRYEAPTKQWVDSLVRPTISFFLFDVQENKEKRETNLQTFRANGRAERRMPPRRIDLMYCVSVFATDISDEHALLWRVLATLMKFEQFPDELLTDSLRQIDPPLRTRIADGDMSNRLTDLWSALGMPPHAALCYILTAPMDLDISIQAPLVLTRTTSYRNLTGDEIYDTALQIGGVVRSKSGNPVDGFTVRRRDSAREGSTTNLEGQFRLGAVPRGRLRLDVLKDGELRKQVEIEVPAESYEIVLDE